VSTLEKYRAYLERCFGKQWQKVLDMYPVQDDTPASRSVSKLLGDSFVSGARALARSMSVIQSKTFLYQFTMQPKTFTFQISGVKNWKRDFGCYHAAEIPYIFHFLQGNKFKGEDRGLSEEMMGYWTRFARSGEPNGDGAVGWPAYNLSQEKHLILNNPVSVGHHLNKQACDRIDRLAEAPFNPSW
jgi:para-nitrobenzyl esterase